MLEPLFEAILEGDAVVALAVTEQALARGVSPTALLMDTMIPAMQEVGRRFECGEYFVPEMMVASRAMKAALEPVRPLLKQSGVQPAGRVVVGTVKGDLHDIGKNLVGTMLEGAGFEVIDIGIDVPPEKFVEAARTTGASVVCLSALLTSTMTVMGTTIEAFDRAGLRGSVKIIVGGAPVTHEYARKIGADGYGESAIDAPRLARSLTVPPR